MTLNGQTMLLRPFDITIYNNNNTQADGLHYTNLQDCGRYVVQIYKDGWVIEQAYYNRLGNMMSIDLFNDDNHIYSCEYDNNCQKHGDEVQIFGEHSCVMKWYHGVILNRRQVIIIPECNLTNQCYHLDVEKVDDDTYRLKNKIIP